MAVSPLFGTWIDAENDNIDEREAWGDLPQVARLLTSVEGRFGDSGHAARLQAIIGMDLSGPLVERFLPFRSAPPHDVRPHWNVAWSG